MPSKKPPAVARPERVILLVAGESGSGKSFFVANLKNALIFDTDIGGGLSYAEERIRRNGSERIEVGSYPEVLDFLNQHRGRLNDFTTVAIDHLSTLHQESVLRWNPKMSKDFGAAGDKAAREWRKVRETVRWGDFHLVCTSHLKGKWEDEKVIGDQADASKKIEGDFHVVLHVYNDGRFDQFPKTCKVHKWRRDPEDARGRIPPSFPFTVGKFLEIHGEPLEGTRQEVAMASAEEVTELTRLVAVVKLPEGTVEKWLAKYKAESFAEFTQDAIRKGIAELKARLTAPAREPGDEEEREGAA